MFSGRSDFQAGPTATSASRSAGSGMAIHRPPWSIPDRAPALCESSLEPGWSMGPIAAQSQTAPGKFRGICPAGLKVAGGETGGPERLRGTGVSPGRGRQAGSAFTGDG